MKISVVIPTRGRPRELARCLGALVRQDRPPDQVLVAIRTDDPDAATVVAVGAELRFPFQAVPVGRADASEARNRCLDLAFGDVLAFTDDDAAPRPDWLARIEARFESDPRLGALGGPDWIDGRAVPIEERPRGVGRVQWWGRTVGNHHLGCGSARPAEWLKGVNLSVRRAAITGLRFGRLLRGRSVQYAEDLALSAAVGRAGWRVLYDPEVAVDHFPSRLVTTADHRSLRDRDTLADASHNETVVMLDHLPALRRPVYLAWAALVGTRLLPGVLLGPGLALAAGSLAPAARALVVLRGRLEGWRTWHGARRSGPVGAAASGPRPRPSSAALARRQP